MTTTIKKTRFEALSRMCLNNWHYIDRKILSFDKEINFFTGHSGSGKSTIIDALQIVLYANTDGRGFFNKAASDDSDRTLIEYLRGMVTIGDNNEFSYLRNRNFSSTIVLEFERTDSGEKQCIGVIFDVETAVNDISRLFFWHTGALLENGYRTKERTMTIEELKTFLKANFEKERMFFTSHNERFRRVMYEVYLGGLDMEKFPLLFKRAIPFRMNGRLEDFVKEYICTEQDIHIEDMQESVLQYGRMQKKIEDTMAEIESLSRIREAYEAMEEKKRQQEKYGYFVTRLELLSLKSRLMELKEKGMLLGEEIEKQKEKVKETEIEAEALESQKEELLKRLLSTGYEELKEKLKSLNEILEIRMKSKVKWDKAALGLAEWEEQEITSNAILWDIEKFRKGTIAPLEIEGLKNALTDLKKDLAFEKKELDRDVEEKKSSLRKVREELEILGKGQKAYPKELKEARDLIARELIHEAGKPVKVEILSDLLDIRDETWRNAVEGYMGNNKLSIVVEPGFVREAMEIYKALDKKKYFRVSVLDTEKITQKEHEVRENALAEEVKAKEPYVQAYIRFLLGNVVKCQSIDQLRDHSIGVTPDCMLYHGYKLTHMNPDNYTKWAYIGADSVRRRLRELQGQQKKLEEELVPLNAEQKNYERLLEMEYLSEATEEYAGWQEDIQDIARKGREKEKLTARLQEMQDKDVRVIKEELSRVKKQKEEQIRLLDEWKKRAWKNEQELEGLNGQYVAVSQELSEKERAFVKKEEFEPELEEFLSTRKTESYSKFKDHFTGLYNKAFEERGETFDRLKNIRLEYLKQYPNRSFPPEKEENTPYEELLKKLECSELAVYREKAMEQAKSAVGHFKEDFMLKIRSAIREAMQRKDELNKIISRLDFGKDKYQFIFTKNKGPDGKFYDMFMDKDLEVDPTKLGGDMERQMNLFTVMHENQYGDLINELISIFIPPENAASEELEEARRNMAKYADYRTYMSFDMQQTIRRDEEEPIKIQLSKMIKKNSGGEGQNPRYVALLASFAQAYRIGMSPKLLRNPTMRLVILDEAFSKMDGEKVASCIRLIRDLGFQVIISATNDKIQNYLENVDRTFVFANPNKKSISIKEFGKTQFFQLSEEIKE